MVGWEPVGDRAFWTIDDTAVTVPLRSPGGDGRAEDGGLLGLDDSPAEDDAPEALTPPSLVHTSPLGSIRPSFGMVGRFPDLNVCIPSPKSLLLDDGCGCGFRERDRGGMCVGGHPDLFWRSFTRCLTHFIIFVSFDGTSNSKSFAASAALITWCRVPGLTVSSVDDMWGSFSDRVSNDVLSLVTFLGTLGPLGPLGRLSYRLLEAYDDRLRADVDDDVPPPPRCTGFRTCPPDAATTAGAEAPRRTWCRLPFFFDRELFLDPPDPSSSEVPPDDPLRGIPSTRPSRVLARGVCHPVSSSLLGGLKDRLLLLIV